jgi:hypothetical protein
MKRSALFLAVCLTACLLLTVAPSIYAQTSGTLRGQVIDPSGAVVPGATVVLKGPAGSSVRIKSNTDGVYEFRNLAPGKYELRAAAKGFAVFTNQDVEIVGGQTQKLDISLTIAMEEQKVEVSDSSTQLDVNPAANAGAIILTGKDLEALSDDPDELAAELQALAGPSAGPNGGQIYIDGFTAGQLPPKSSIREIRINQNPFSAEYEKLGYGRIEIFTKPGTDQFHGQLFITGNTAGFNARNPFETVPAGESLPGYDSTQFNASLSGPISKKASFFFNVERRNINNLNIINTPFVDPTTFDIERLNESVGNSTTRTNLGPRFDWQLTPSNTLTLRYQFFRDTGNNEGISEFSLPTVAYNTHSTEHTLQISDTQTLSPKVVNETRFQFIRATSDQVPLSLDTTVSVQGAFSSGGNSKGTLRDTLDRYEFQNHTSMTLGKHFLKFGVRLRGSEDSNFASSNFNGTFSFGSRPNPNCSAISTPCTPVTGIQAYQLTLQDLAGANPLTIPQIIAAGGGASQYSVTLGTGQASVSYFDAGLYVQDDWRVRQNITLSAGLRYESQNDIGDHADFAPRLAFAWGIGAKGKNPPKMVLRGGWGIFYDRFTSDDVLTQQRLNGVVQQQFVVINPQFFLPDAPKTPAQLLALGVQIPPTVYTPNPNLRTPYLMQTGVTLERQLTKYANLSLTYLNSRGVHQFFTENINAPICTIFPCDPTNTIANPRPDPSAGNIYQYQSEGIYKQNQFIINTSVRMGAKLSLFGYYTLNYANSDAAGIGSLPSVSNNISLDYGRAAFDVRHRVFFGGTWGLPHGFRLSPFLIASSGMPFNVVSGQDVNGDSIFNDRPSFASSHSLPNDVVATKFGNFDTVPQPGEALVPVNMLTGPNRFTLNLRLSKTFGFGKKTEATNTGRRNNGGAGGLERGAGQGGPGGAGGGGRGGGGFGGGRGGGLGGGESSGQRYSLTFSVSARNIFNNVNLGLPVGNLSSPFFGTSNALAGQPYSSSSANRRIDLQATFTF